jgi:post-segregation antitoxin (ccd killing protein)
MSRPYPFGVREPAFDYQATKQTVSLTINSDLMARVKAVGINASRVAEEALAKELERRRAEALREELKADVGAFEAFVAKHGSFAAMVRDHYKQSDDDAV